MVFAENDDMIRAFSADAPIEPFYISVLPRATVGCDDLFDSHSIHASPEVSSIDRVPVSK